MGTATVKASDRGPSNSPKQTTKKSPRQGTKADSKVEKSKKNTGTNADVAKPLAPPPRPGQNNDTQDFQQQNNTNGGSLSLEPNPFEQSFGGGNGPETPGGTKLPPVASLTSPSSLLPGSNATPFNWGGGSLRTGPLSPAMLSGPANDYFGDTHHIRGGFPTPNESSLRSGLTPGGSGSMFPVASPSSQALFTQLASGGATPNTLDFHRTAMSVAAKRELSNGVHTQNQQTQVGQQNQANGQMRQSATSQAQDMSGAPAVKVEGRAASGPFDPHDNDAANGLFMLAQGRNGATNGNQFATNPAAGAHPHAGHANRQNNTANGGSRGGSEGTNASADSEPSKPNTRGKGRKNASTTNVRRKADEAPAKAPPAKKAKMDIRDMSEEPSEDDEGDDDDDDKLDGGSKSKMTDEEKRKNFLERNRVAALKCRQRKKQWLANLQTKVEMFSSENDALTSQITQLREEVVNLKTLLLAHKDCPVTQQQGLHGAFMQQVVEPFNSQMNPYGMAGSMANQPVMAGQGIQRRFS